MNAAIPEFLQPCLAEATLAAGCVAMLALSRAKATAQRAGDLALVVIAASAVGAVVSMDGLPGWLAGGTLVADPFAALSKFVLSMIALAVVWMSTRSREADGDGPHDSPLSWALFMLSLLGMDLMVSASHVATAWASFEMVNVSLALWMAAQRGHASAGVAMAALLEGAAASTWMLIGFALLYGLSGTLEYADLHARLAPSLAAPGGRSVMFAAIALVIAGVGYRLAMVPWPRSRIELAESTSLAVAAWVQAGSTIAGLAMLARLLRTALSEPGLDGTWITLPGVEWPALLSVIAMVTMTVGNVAALRETRVLRLLAWLSMVQVGYLVSGLVALSDKGLEAALFHGVAYAAMTIGLLATIAPIVEQAGSDDFEVLRGLGRRRGGARMLALALIVLLLSLSAVPPLAGHEGRSLLLAAVFESGRWALAFVAACNSALGLLCCARVVAILLDRPHDADENVPLDFETVVVAGLLVAASVGLGLWPDPLASFLGRSVVFFDG